MNMIQLSTITEKSVFNKELFENKEEYQRRSTVRAFILKNDEVGLIYNKTTKLYSFPGGGADSDNLIEEIKRECLEETQVIIKNPSLFGTVEEIRNRDAKKYNTTYFVVYFDSIVNEDLRTEDEKNHGIELRWIQKSEVLKVLNGQFDLLKSNSISFYNTAFNVYRDYLFWKEFLKKEINT